VQLEGPMRRLRNLPELTPCIAAFWMQCLILRWIFISCFCAPLPCCTGFSEARIFLKDYRQRGGEESRIETWPAWSTRIPLTNPHRGVRANNACMLYCHRLQPDHVFLPCVLSAFQTGILDGIATTIFLMNLRR